MDNGGCCVLLSAVDSDDPETEYPSTYLRVSDGRDPVIAELGFVARAIVHYDGATLAMGRLGDYAWISDDELSMGRIDGPGDYGFLTAVRVIGDAVFAVGMSRQVYVCRTAGGDWVRYDAGVLDESIDVGAVTGFRAVDGFGVEELYAVGFDGEIWTMRGGTWARIDSPTNVALEDVRVMGAGRVCAVGKSGVVLLGRGGVWQAVDQSETEEDLCALEPFAGRLYVASEHALYALDDAGGFKQIDLPSNRPAAFACLRASIDALWSFGPFDVFKMSPSGDWQELKLF
jgi:hypothetical protein